MSTGNIINRQFGRSGYVVAFQTKHGPMYYKFSSVSGVSIESGTDPSELAGQRITESEYNSELRTGIGIAEDAAIDAAELL